MPNTNFSFEFSVILGLGLPFYCAQFLFWWVFVFRFFYKLKLNSVKEQNKEQEAVSIIVPAKNELENLKELLPLLYAQDYSKFEIIIVDDRSVDGTRDFLLAESIRKKQLKPIRIEECPFHLDGKKYAITLAVKKASYDRLLFTDADCRPKTNRWIAEMVCSSKTDLVCGPAFYFSGKTMVEKQVAVDGLLSNLLIWIFQTWGQYSAIGRNLSYTRKYFLEKGGFYGYYDHKGGDDDLFVNKNANQETIYYNTSLEASTFSFPKKKWWDWLHQKQRHSFASLSYKKGLQLAYLFFGLSYSFSWLLAILSPITNFMNLAHYLPLVLGLTTVVFWLWKFQKKYELNLNVFSILVYCIFIPVYQAVLQLPGLTLSSTKVKWK